jgi:hypothetical protein
VRRSEAPFLALEIAWLRAAELPKLTRIEELLAAGATAAGPPAAAPGARGDRAAAAPGTRQRAGRPTPEARAESPPAARAPAPRPAEPAAPAGEPDDGDGFEFARPGPASTAPSPEASDSARRAADLCTAFDEELARRKPPLAAHLRDVPKEVVGDRLLLHLAQDDEIRHRRLAGADNRRVLDEVARAVGGEPFRWEVHVAGAPVAETAPPEPDEETAAAAPAAAVAGDPAVQRVLELFQGRVEEVEEVGGDDDRP